MFIGAFDSQSDLTDLLRWSKLAAFVASYRALRFFILTGPKIQRSAKANDMAIDQNPYYTLVNIQKASKIDKTKRCDWFHPRKATVGCWWPFCLSLFGPIPFSSSKGPGLWVLGHWFQSCKKSEKPRSTKNQSPDGYQKLPKNQHHSWQTLFTKTMALSDLEISCKKKKLKYPSSPFTHRHPNPPPWSLA